MKLKILKNLKILFKFLKTENTSSFFLPLIKFIFPLFEKYEEKN